MLYPVMPGPSLARPQPRYALPSDARPGHSPGMLYPVMPGHRPGHSPGMLYPVMPGPWPGHSPGMLYPVMPGPSLARPQPRYALPSDAWPGHSPGMLYPVMPGPWPGHSPGMLYPVMPGLATTQVYIAMPPCAPISCGVVTTTQANVCQESIKIPGIQYNAGVFPVWSVTNSDPLLPRSHTEHSVNQSLGLCLLSICRMELCPMAQGHQDWELVPSPSLIRTGD
ncbi:hypothetical protein EMCRGX_G007728 [Ephydatia muelleri]|eukprot:Em0002g795a